MHLFYSRPISLWKGAVWNFQTHGHLTEQVSLRKKVEKVQKRATKIVPSCIGLTLSYMERLKVLGIPTLKYRRCRGDIIETFNILHGIYDTAVAPALPICQDSVTGGNSCKLVKNFSRYDVRKYYSVQRIVNTWNSLPAHVVNSSSVHSFKNNDTRRRTKRLPSLRFSTPIRYDTKRYNRECCFKIKKAIVKIS